MFAMQRYLTFVDSIDFLKLFLPTTRAEDIFVAFSELCRNSVKALLNERSFILTLNLFGLSASTF